MGLKKFDLKIEPPVPTQEILSLLRFVVFDDMDNIEQLESFRTKTAITPPFSRQNELKVMKMILRLCWKSFAAYPRTLKGDQDLLERDDLTTNQRNALMFTI